MTGFDIDGWDDKKFVLDLKKSLKVGTSLHYSERDLKKEIIRNTKCDVDDSEKCFQKMMKKGLELCSPEISLPGWGTQYNVTEYGIIRGYLNPKDTKEGEKE